MKSDQVAMPLPANWQCYADAEAVAQAAVAQILACANQAIAERGAFHLVTAGGTTPNRCYQLLREANNQAWSRWFIYMGDERVLPSDHAERNSQALYQAWLSFDKIPAQNIFTMPTELGLTESVNYYQQVVEKIEQFDLVLLGMGEDGHTASLFPDHTVGFEPMAVVAEYHSPKPPAERLSLSYQRLNASRNMLKLITGKGKHAAIQAWLSGEALPINQTQAQQNTWVYLDTSAWSGD